MQTVINQFVYFAYFQSLFLLFIYIFSPKSRKNINGYLAFLIVLLAVGLTGRIIYISELFGQNFRFYSFSEFSILMFGSTIYLFTRSSLKGAPFHPSDLIHYIPGVIYILIIVVYFMLPSDQIIGERAKSGELYRSITLLVGIGLAFNITYWILSCRIFFQVKKGLRNELSYSIKTQFFSNFLTAIGLCLTCWLVVYFISILGVDTIERTARRTIWLGIALIILFIAYYGIKEPELFKFGKYREAKKYQQSKLSMQDLDNLKTTLETLMTEKKPYLNRKLAKSELSEMLGVSNPEIARLLNERIGMNFFEYVNFYRIKEFVELAKSQKAENLTFFGLAQEAGFNSKTTFNKSFKKLMGMSPKDYFQN
ncbi:AraC family transcriptional regulator [Flagellimonas aquimarina]|uniref:AraC family transcriptional regulator n=1 Tax=Flagellimonas aquimarina TaxID=2201895 RepID=A0A316KUF9_9FLAO|nr:helix-turn-helix domain-containing protein [Allomuricauda koreensis]PWL37832.1 AraC family transcriptional regulator [Allomuricauda koreensis]